MSLWVDNCTKLYLKPFGLIHHTSVKTVCWCQPVENLQFLLLEVSNVLTDGLVEIERPLRKKCRRDRQCHKQSNREIRNRLMKEGKSFLTRLSESCQGMWGRIINTSCALLQPLMLHLLLCSISTCVRKPSEYCSIQVEARRTASTVKPTIVHLLQTSLLPFNLCV